MSNTADILVVGAGPAGLALALQAHDHGAAVRIIDRRPDADRPSRALILHSRTLEVLRPLGVTQALLAQADIAPTADLQLGSRVIRVTLADLALPDTAFPHLSLIRQMDVERVLAEALADRGIEIERGTELHDLLAGSGVHILLDRDADALGTWPSRFVSIHRLTSSPGRGLIAVRPDGYVGFRCQRAEIGQLANWLAMFRGRSAQAPASSDLSTYLL